MITVDHYTAEVPRESGERAREMIDAAQGDPNGRYACVEITTNRWEHDEAVCPFTGYNSDLCGNCLTREGT